MKYFRIFVSTCFILKYRENVGKLDSQSDEGIFLTTPPQARLIRYTTKEL